MENVDAVVVGAGPSGLFAGWELARGGASTIVTESGPDMTASLCPKVAAHLKNLKLREAEKYRLQCHRCTCLEGLGGAAFHFDTTLGYFETLSRSKIETARDKKTIRRFSGLERALGSFDLAGQLIREVYEICFDHGLPREHVREDDEFLRSRASAMFHHVDTAKSQLVHVDSAIEMIEGLRSDIDAQGASQVMLETRVIGVEDGARRRWRVLAERAGRPVEIETDAVVLAVGKCALPLVLSLIQSLGVKHTVSTEIDLGVRVETPREDLAPLVSGCHNPKLSFVNERGEAVRTFCVTEGGRLMQYLFMGVPVLEGQHCFELPTTRTNIGIVTTVKMAPGEDGTQYALEFGRAIADAGDGHPIAQRVGELFDVPDRDRGEGEPLRTSLVAHKVADFREVYPSQLLADAEGMITRFNEISPGTVNGDAVLVAPIIERVFPNVALSHRMETSRKGLYMVGDCSGKLIGITYGAATGLAAARDILGSAA